jgi:2-enoate reductase
VKEGGMKLFQPGKIGGMVTRNRIVMCPMGTGSLADEDGGFSRRLISYYGARARGGAGLIITGASIVYTELEPGMGLRTMTRVTSKAHLGRLSDLCAEVHNYGARIAIQLSPGLGRVGVTDLQPISASAVPYFWDPRITTRELSIHEIETLITAYAFAAGIVRAAGADAIEIHGYGGYLIDQFQTALWNKRSDRYGGDLEGRLRFPLELIDATRKVVGGDFPLIYKFTPDHYIEGGRDLSEGVEIARRLEDAGVDALHVDGGCYEVWHRVIPCMYEPPGCHLHLAEAVKKAVNIPVIVHGKLGNPMLAEKVIEEGKADFVGLGRPLLADPDWPEKVRQGKFDDIRPCIGDNEGCIRRVYELKHISCTVNPAAGMEREYALVPATRRKLVLVVGGGPAGAEAAMVSALRGHHVSLWEKNDRLGGKLIPASVPDFKQDLRPLIEYFSAQMNKLGVSVELGREATAERIRQFSPDVVILATGSTPFIPPLPGIGKGKVTTAIDVLLGKSQPGNKLIVAGGGSVGCEVALYLHGQGKRVTLIEMMKELLPEDINLNTRMGLLSMIKQSGIEVLTETRLVAVTDDGVLVSCAGGEKELKADSVVLALGFRPESQLRQQLEGIVPELFVIGDCLQPRKIINAIWEGFHTARSI